VWQHSSARVCEFTAIVRGFCCNRGAGAGGGMSVYFPKSYTIGVVVLVLFFFIGLLLFVYFQGGVESAIRLRR